MGAVLLIIGGAMGLAAAPTLIIPPRDVVDPVMVHVLDYGYHSRLVLPAEHGGLVAFAYGEYRWFARGKTDWHRVPAVLFWPTPGTLGLDEAGPMPGGTTLDHLSRRARRMSFEVESWRAAALRRRLEERFRAGGEPIRNPPMGRIQFVPDPAGYTFWHTCNHAVAAWLRELDCRVIGWPVMSNFRLRAEG